MEEELRALSEELRSCDRDLAGRRRVDAGLRSRIVTTVRRLRQAGWRWRPMAEALDVGESQLHRWVATAPESAFAEVDLVSDETDKEAGKVGAATLTLVTPSGFELHGLSFGQAQSLLVSLASGGLGR